MYIGPKGPDCPSELHPLIDFFTKKAVFVYCHTQYFDLIHNFNMVSFKGMVHLTEDMASDDEFGPPDPTELHNDLTPPQVFRNYGTARFCKTSVRCQSF